MPGEECCAIGRASGRKAIPALTAGEPPPRGARGLLARCWAARGGRNRMRAVSARVQGGCRLTLGGFSSEKQAGRAVARQVPRPHGPCAAPPRCTGFAGAVLDGTGGGDIAYAGRERAGQGGRRLPLEWCMLSTNLAHPLLSSRPTPSHVCLPAVCCGTSACAQLFRVPLPACHPVVPLEPMGGRAQMRSRGSRTLRYARA